MHEHRRGLMRLGTKEREVLKLALAHYTEHAGLTKGEAAYASKLAIKLDAKAAAPVAARAVGVNAGPIHDALVDAAGGRVASMRDAGPAWWARASRRMAALGATSEKAKVVGLWLANQTWMTGTTSWDTVLAKWDDWSARAHAEFSTSEGSGTGQGTQTGRRKASWGT